MKVTRVKHTVPGWVSFKIETGTNKNGQHITKEALIESLKNRLKDIELRHGEEDE